MGTRGFTLVEMIIVMSIIAILSSIAVLNWNRMTTKSNIEGQIKSVHADLMTVRAEALYGKRARSVVLSGKEYRVYSSSVVTSSPLATKSFKFNFIPSGDNKVTFDTSGMTNGTQVSICVDPYNDKTIANDAAIDSLVVSQARINLGKRDEGGNCVTGDIKQK
ncbi:MAG TPA: type II secretion system protein [Geobacteraceae bacterium]|nr:type II secretion system protein [Geobacteraceae bacterium]